VWRTLACVLLTAALLPAGDDPHEDALAAAGVSPDRAGVQRYLRSLAPDEATLARVDRLIGDLGSAESVRRENASREISRLQAAALGRLLAAERSQVDPEARRRIRLLAEHARRFVEASLLHAAMTLVLDRKWTGLADEVLKTIEPARASGVMRVAQDALCATVRPDDLRLLRRVIASDAGGDVRASAVLALNHLLGAGAHDEVRALLADGDPRVRLAAAWCLADAGDRAAPAAFVALLDADDAAVRQQAVCALRQISRQQFGYLVEGTPAERAPSVKLWRAWLDRAPATLAWKTPLDRSDGEMERILVTCYQDKRVLELDRNGKVLWEQGELAGPWAAFGMPNGHRLVLLLQASAIVEYDAKGAEVARLDNLPGSPISVQRLANGNTLFAAGGGNQVFEVRPNKSVAWSALVGGTPTDAKRLANGHTLVALWGNDVVVELDRGGKIVRELAVKRPYHVQRLRNGNTLVCANQGTQVVELDGTGKVVWSRDGLQNCYSAQRLANGSTLIADSRGLGEVDPDGQVRWLHRTTNGLCRAFPY